MERTMTQVSKSGGGSSSSSNNWVNEELSSTSSRHSKNKSKKDRRSSVESDEGHQTSLRLLASLANDYSLYLKTDLSCQISKVEEFVEESLAKLEEYQSLFEMKEGETKAWIAQLLPDLMRTGTLLSVTLNQRLDTLTSLILSIQSAMDALEGQLGQTEARFGIPSPTSTSTIRSVFKYFIRPDESGSDANLAGGKKPNPPSLEQLQSEDPLQLVDFFH